MAKSEKTVLYSPAGEKYETTSKTEATRLKAHGYSTKAPKASSTTK